MPSPIVGVVAAVAWLEDPAILAEARRRALVGREWARTTLAMFRLIDDVELGEGTFDSIAAGLYKARISQTAAPPGMNPAHP